MKKRFILQFWKKTKIYLKKLDSFKVSFLKKEEKSKNRKMKEMIFKKCNFIKLENGSNKFFDMNQSPLSTNKKLLKQIVFCRKTENEICRICPS